jgi:hypothetical protein
MPDILKLLERAQQGKLLGRGGSPKNVTHLLRWAAVTIQGGIRTDDWDSIAEALLMLVEALNLLDPRMAEGIAWTGKERKPTQRETKWREAKRPAPKTDTPPPEPLNPGASIAQHAVETPDVRWQHYKRPASEKAT